MRYALHDVGGQPDARQRYTDKGEEDWDMNTYVTCECLGWRGIWNSCLRRRAENDLGMTQYFGFPYYRPVDHHRCQDAHQRRQDHAR